MKKTLFIFILHFFTSSFDARAADIDTSFIGVTRTFLQSISKHDGKEIAYTKKLLEYLSGKKLKTSNGLEIGGLRAQKGTNEEYILMFDAMQVIAKSTLSTKDLKEIYDAAVLPLKDTISIYHPRLLFYTISYMKELLAGSNQKQQLNAQIQRVEIISDWNMGEDAWFTKNKHVFEEMAKKAIIRNHKYSISNILRENGWMEYTDKFAIHPQLHVGGTVSYFGNVPPTSLYKHGKHFILPTAPYVHPYNPHLFLDYVSFALEVKPTEIIKQFFGQSDIEKVLIVFQKLINTGEPQSLRLHGFIHGENAGSVNASTNVATEIKPIHGKTEITFADDTLSKTESVHTHDGVASPNNFTLKGFKPNIYTNQPIWQAMALYLPASKTATLIVFGQTFFNSKILNLYNHPILIPEAVTYLQKLLSQTK